MTARNFARIIEFIRELYPGEETVPLHAPRFRGREKDYLADCIDSTFVSYVGAYVTRFEEAICEFTGAAHAVGFMHRDCALRMPCSGSTSGRGLPDAEPGVTTAFDMIEIEAKAKQAAFLFKLSAENS